MHIVLNWGFLYFPEDKSTYLPAVIEMLLLILLCVFVFKWVRKISAREAVKAQKIEQEMLAKGINKKSQIDNK